MPVYVFGCDGCGRTYEIEMTFEQAQAADVECAECARAAFYVPPRFAIGGSAQGRAAKIAQEVAEQDFGMTNFNLGRPGEPAVPPPQIPDPAGQGIQVQGLLSGMIGNGPARIDPSPGGEGWAPIREMREKIKRGDAPDLVARPNIERNAIRLFPGR